MRIYQNNALDTFLLVTNEHAIHFHATDPTTIAQAISNTMDALERKTLPHYTRAPDIENQLAGHDIPPPELPLTKRLPAPQSNPPTPIPKATDPVPPPRKNPNVITNPTTPPAATPATDGTNPNDK